MQESHRTKSFSKPTQSIQSHKCKSSPQTAFSKSHTDLPLSIFKDTFAALAGLQQTHAGKTTFHHPFPAPHAEPITWSSPHVHVGDVRLSFGYFRLKRIIASWKIQTTKAETYVAVTWISKKIASVLPLIHNHPWTKVPVTSLWISYRTVSSIFLWGAQELNLSQQGDHFKRIHKKIFSKQPKPTAIQEFHNRPVERCVWPMWWQTHYQVVFLFQVYRQPL